VQHMCDRVAILTQRKYITSGSVSDVLHAGRATGVVARLADPAAGVVVLAAAGIEASVADGSLRATIQPTDAARVTQVLADAGLYVSELRPDEADLETVFLELTEEA